MRWWFVFILYLPILTSGCALRLSEMTDIEKTERLATEKGRVLDETDPVNKTRSYITISQILLDFVGDSARAQDMEGMRSLLEQYTMAVQAARDTIVNSGRDPERRPAGYRELEIALRQQLRILDDISGSLTVIEREPVDRALQTATAVRGEILRLLFPQGATTG